MERMTPRRAVAALAAALGVALAVLLPGSAAAARTVDVVLTAERPATVSLAPGDSVRFVSGEDGPLGPPHQVTATADDGTAEWEYTSPILAPGDSTGPVAFERAGTYLFVDRRGGPGPLGSEVVGRIVVQAPRPAASSAPPRTAAPVPPPADTGSSAPPAPAPAAPRPAPAADAPAVLGGVTSAPLDVALPADAVVPPALAGLDLGVDEPGLAADDERTLVQAQPGPLPGEPTSRGLGLPASLAVVAAVGVASLLVRVLLAEPEARRPLAVLVQGGGQAEPA